MPRKLAKNFFIRDGQPLNPKNVDHIESPTFVKEAISTLSNVKPSKREVAQEKYLEFREGLNTVFTKNFISAKSPFLATSLIASVLFATFLFKIPLYKQKETAPIKYSLFSSIPLTLDTVDYDLDFRDSRAVKIDSVMNYFNCPMAGLGTVFVEKADENDIPYWVVAAVAFQESSCGKNTPSIEGAETYNAWGWATYGDSVYKFDSFEQGIDVVSRYLSKKFYSKGITDTCEIMKTYTPPSNGSWCKGVDYFGDFIRSYKTPEY